jgi:hypothetical protein
MDVAFKMVGNWSMEMDVPLNNALQATTELTGRSGRSAVERAMSLMAKSAKVLTRQAKKNLKVQRDNKRRFVEKTLKAGKKVNRWEFQYPNDRGETWEQAKLIGNRGLAKRSWLWGLSGLRKPPKSSKEIKGVSMLTEFFGKNQAGMILTNRLNYINYAIPSNLPDIVAKRASNQIMAQAAKKLEREYGVVVPRLAASRRKRAAAQLAREFKKAKR